MPQIKECGACHNTELLKLSLEIPQSMRSDGLILNEPLSKFHCPKCGMLNGTNTQPSNRYLRSTGTSVFDLKRHMNVAQGISKLLRKYNIGNKANILEIGASNFQTSLSIKQLNNSFSVTAIEPSPEQTPNTNEIEIVIEDYMTWKAPIKFDAIFSNQVIEHLQSTQYFLAKSAHDLSDKGYIFVCCPTYEPSHNEILFTDHIYNFTPQAIDQYCKLTGLKLYDHHIAPWDSLTHIYIIQKETLNVECIKYQNADPERLYKARVNYLQLWSNQQSLALEALDTKAELLLYGAGEFSQLIKTYLPEVYSKVSKIIVDDLNGVREFDRNIAIFSDSSLDNCQILIGTQLSSRNVIKQKLLNAGVESKNIISLSV